MGAGEVQFEDVKDAGQRRHTHLTQLNNTTGRGLKWEEIRAKQSEITKAEYSQLLTYLPHSDERLLTSDDEVGGSTEKQYQLPAPQHPACCPLVREPTLLPPCIAGRVSSIASYERFVLEQCPGEMISDVEISQLSDSQLMDHMCTARAVFQYTTDGAPGVILRSRVSDSTFLSLEYLHVQGRGGYCGSSPGPVHSDTSIWSDWHGISSGLPQR
jgi:hypothetical protein